MHITYTTLIYSHVSQAIVSHIRNIVMFIALCSILTSCSDKKCIDADDFGFPTATVKASFAESELQGSSVMQVAPWIDSGYVLNGDPVTIMVKNWISGVDYNNDGEVSAWCPWYAQGTPQGMLSDLCERLQECVFIGGKMTAQGPDLPALGAPCVLSKGKGLYALLTRPAYDPNKSENSKALPKGVNFHLGENTVSEYEMYDIDRLGNSHLAGGASYSFHDTDTAHKYTGGGLFFKILDKYYEDNSGQYRLIIKSGVDLGSGDPITFLTNTVRNKLYGSSDGVSYGLVEGLYRKIVGTPEFKNIVRGMITLYVVISALSFLAGTMKATHTEFIGRLIKMTIVSVLLTSDQSWTFFKDYLFVYFIDGVQFIMYSIQKAGAGGPGAINILGLMMAQETFTKLFSLLFVDYRGFVYILLYLILLFFMIKVIFFATVIYLVALVTISMIIILGPFFICMVLFEFTRPFFDNWLKELIKYSLIPIILFTGISFMGSIVRHEIYSSLGFKVCKRDLFAMPNLKIFTDTEGKYETQSSLLYWWYPSKFMDDRNSLSASDKISNALSGNSYNSVAAPSIEAVIPVPEAYLADDGTYCKAYECFKKRNIDYPFLDLEKDAERLEKFKSNNFVDLISILILFVMVILLDRFNKSAEMIAQMLANATSSKVNVSNVARGASGALFSAAASAAGSAMSANRSSSASTAPSVAAKVQQRGGAASQPSVDSRSKPMGGKKTLTEDAISSKAKTPPPAVPPRKTVAKTQPVIPPRRDTAKTQSSAPQSAVVTPKPKLTKAEKAAEGKKFVKNYMKQHPGATRKAARRALHRKRMRGGEINLAPDTTSHTVPPSSQAQKVKPTRRKPSVSKHKSQSKTHTQKKSKRKNRGRRR